MDNQNRAIEEWAACWSAHDVERLLRLFSADVIYEDVPMGVINRGASELRAFGERVFSDPPWCAGKGQPHTGPGRLCL
jgi:ketosteroid isomerase-like protein